MKVLLLLLAPPVMASLLACTETTPACPEKEPAPPDKEPAPSIASEITARWEAPPDGAFRALASAYANDEGAIAYAELEALDGGGSFTRTRIKLQRLNSMGALHGPSIELGVVESTFLSGLTLAGDGDRYVACWADDSQIACATAPVGQGSASPGQSMAGVAPSLAYSSGTWALAYGVPGSLAVVHLADDGMAVGSPVMFEAGEDLGVTSLPLLAATKLGFFLVGGDEVRVHALNFAFLSIAEAVDLGVRSWAYGAIAGSEAKVAIHLSKPYGSNLFLLEDGVLTSTQPFTGGGKGGLRAALAADGTSLGMLMPKVDPNGVGVDELLYRILPQGCAPASEQAQDVDFTIDVHDPRALLRVKDDMFLATIPGQQEVVVARVHRP